MKTFSKGGIKIPDKKLSAATAIENFPLPEFVYIPIAQHIGAPAIPLVSINDHVKTGQLIAKSDPDAGVSSNIHASVTGTIVNIFKTSGPQGRQDTIIQIKAESDVWADGIDFTEKLVKDFSFSSEEIIEKVKKAGIVGMGGATFPTHLKLSYKGEKKFHTLIINGAECEPYITSDHRLMLEKGEELIIGIKLLMKAIQVDKSFIGIEENKGDAIEHLQKLLRDDLQITVVPLKPKYPQGGEKQLIRAVTGKEIPLHKLPPDMGYAVQNVSTVYAVYEAVQKNKPLIERTVTVSGTNIKNPSNFKVRIGTKVCELIAKAGLKSDEKGAVISGGPMMGREMEHCDFPVTKGTTAILVFTHKDLRKVKPGPCIRCGKCLDACPQGFEPCIFAVLSENEDYDHPMIQKINNCFECGSCTYVCPSGRPLLSMIKNGKTHITKRNKKAC